MPKRVLIVEDDLALRTVVRFNVQRAGFDVVVAANGREGWQALERQPCDLVVSDQQMPEMTGLELCQRMRQDARFANVPLMLLTGKGFELDAEALRRELGVFALMPKPFSPLELVAAVRDRLALVASNVVENERKLEAAASSRTEFIPFFAASLSATQTE